MWQSERRDVYPLGGVKHKNRDNLSIAQPIHKWPWDIILHVFEAQEQVRLDCKNKRGRCEQGRGTGTRLCFPRWETQGWQHGKGVKWHQIHTLLSAQKGKAIARPNQAQSRKL